EELRTRDAHAALMALDEQMAAYRPYLDLSLERLRERARQAAGPEGTLLAKVSGPAWGGMKLYHSLSPAEHATLQAGQELTFTGGAADPGRRLPEEWRRPLLEAWGMAIVPFGDTVRIGPIESLRSEGAAATPLVDYPGANPRASLKIN